MLSSRCLGALSLISLVLVVQSSLLRSNSDRPDTASGGEEKNSRALQVEPIDVFPVQIGEDCSANETSCSYFRPNEFALRKAKWVANVGRMWDNMIEDPMSALCKRMSPWLTDLYHVECMEDGLEPRKKTCRPLNFRLIKIFPDTHPRLYLPRDFTFKHVRKAGGNTFLRLFWDLEENELPRFHVNNMRASQEENAEEMAEEHLTFVENKQKEGKGYPFFSIVRNPVSRFVSIVTEIMRDSADVQALCGSMDQNTDTIKCVLDEIESGIDNVHIIPMFADIYCGMKGHDIEVSLYNMDDIGNVLKAFGADPEERHNEGAGLSVSDLDSDLIRRICTLYAWDVAMMEEAGFPVPECSIQMGELLGSS